MRLSLKLLLLIVTFVAILAAWMRVHHELGITKSRLLRNANQGTRTIAVPEASAPPSALTIDATGTVTQAQLYGPAGYAAINEHAGSRNEISSLWFGSTEAIELFEPMRFPNLTWLSIDDSFDVDFSQLSLDWIKAVHMLEGMNIHARTSDPRPSLSTIPQMQSLMLVLRTNQVDSFDTFPQLRSVSHLSIGVPDDCDTDAILQELHGHSLNCTIEVRNGYNP